MGDIFQKKKGFWQLLQLPNHPSARSSAGLASTPNGDVWLLGGEDSKGHAFDDKLYRLCKSTGEWSVVKTQGSGPGKVFAHVMVAIKDNLYVFGGRVGPATSDLSSNDVFEFNTKTMTWCKLSVKKDPCPARSHAAFVSDRERYFYIFSGLGGDGRFNDVWSFDCKKTKWKFYKAKKGTPPSVRGGAGMSLMGDKLYVFGGFDGEEMEDTQCYDTNKKTWTALQPVGLRLPKPRSVFCYAGNEQGNLFMFGGEKEPAQGAFGGSFLNDALLFLPRAQEWQMVSLMDSSKPSARGWTAACVLGDGQRVAMFGGYDGTQRFDEFWVWAPEEIYDIERRKKREQMEEQRTQQHSAPAADEQGADGICRADDEEVVSQSQYKFVKPKMPFKDPYQDNSNKSYEELLAEEMAALEAGDDDEYEYYDEDEEGEVCGADSDEEEMAKRVKKADAGFFSGGRMADAQNANRMARYY